MRAHMFVFCVLVCILYPQQSDTQPKRQTSMARISQLRKRVCFRNMSAECRTPGAPLATAPVTREVESKRLLIMMAESSSS